MARFNPKKARREADVEWVGGRFAAPAFVTGEGEPFRPETLVWLDIGNELVVFAKSFRPDQGIPSLADALEEAMARPMAGPKRRPSRVRVASSADAAELRARFGTAIQVSCAPTPEVAEVADSLAEHAAREAPPDNWLEHLPAGAPEIPRFFQAAARLFRAAPWDVLFDEDDLHVDVPALGIHGACLSVMGGGGQSFGFLLFPSLTGYEAFLDVVEEAQDDGAPPEDFGTTWLALELERSADVPRELRKLIAQRNLPLAATDAVPWPQEVERDGVPRPLSLESLSALAAVANALAELVTEQRDALERGDTFSSTIRSDAHPPVRLSLPYEAGATTAEPVAPAPAVPGRRSPAHDIDAGLAGRMMVHADERFGRAWRRFRDDLVDGSESLAVPWAVYVFPVKGRPVSEHFLEDCADTLSAPERTWLEAQRDALASFWEVTRVEPGRSLSLRCLLSGETREVHELSASRSVAVRGVLFGRVVPYGDHSVLAGLHPRSLGPGEADLALRAAKTRLRAKRAPRLAPEALRPYKASRVLLEEWERAVELDDARRAVPPKLQNTDGDPLLFTIDHFAFSPADRAEVVRRLAALPGAEPEQPGSENVTFLAPGNAIHASWDNTVIGRAEPQESSLRVEANSLRRADQLRTLVEAALAPLVTHRAREHADPSSARAGAGTGPLPSPEAMPPEVLAMLRELKERHARDWLDTEVPALNGKTPRAAAKSKAGRQQLDVLLREIEMLESQAPPEMRGDIGWLRRELGME